jgi:hypothetical protein
MLTLTAELVAQATSTEQVGNRRGRVQHVAAAPALTPAGNLRRGHGPVCGQHARRWTVLVADPRPLCARCTSWARRRRPDIDNAPYLHATAAQIRAALLTVSSRAELHRITYAICLRPDLVHHVVLDDAAFKRRRLTAYVSDARSRIATSSRKAP